MRTIMFALAVLIAGCSASTTPPTPGPNPTPVPPAVVNPAVQTAINIGVNVAAGLGCKMIPASAKPVAQIGLNTVGVALNQGPAQALKALENLAQNPAVSFLWSALHSVIDKLNGLTGAQWYAYVEGAIAAAVSGCQGAL